MGVLQYLTFTRPNICFAVNRVYQFMHAPIYSHWATVKHILRYLKGTTSYGFHITRSSLMIKKSTSGYLVFFGQTPISWKSSKQRTITRSFTEVEYKALGDDTANVIWLQYLLTNSIYLYPYHLV